MLKTTTTIEMMVWTHVEQGLPPVGDDVVAMTPGGMEVVAFYGIGGNWWTSNMPLMTLDVVAWRPATADELKEIG